MDSSALDTFRAFRSSLYNCLHRRADALFELTDALLTAEQVPSPVHLSLQPSHRRGWGGLYNALSHGRIDAQALRTLSWTAQRAPLRTSQALSGRQEGRRNPHEDSGRGSFARGFISITKLSYLKRNSLLKFARLPGQGLDVGTG